LCGPARAPGCRHEVPHRGPCFFISAGGPKDTCCCCWPKVDVPRRRYCQPQWQHGRVGSVPSLNSCFVPDNGAWRHQKAPLRENISCQRLSPEVWQGIAISEGLEDCDKKASADCK
jgi:hypothetical protein